MNKLRIVDSLKNFVANLGTSRDKATGARYSNKSIPDDQLINAYEGTWLPRKVVDIPALDSTRKWRAWQAAKDQITAIEAEEKRLGVKNKVKDAMQKARLFGGAGIYISVKGDKDPSLPLNPDHVAKQGIDFITVLPRRVLQAGDIETDPLLPTYGQPKYYRVSSGTGSPDIHPSRIIRFIGASPADDEISSQFGWGDSVLKSAFDSCVNVDSAMANIGSLIYESKVDVLGIPGLTDLMADPQTRTLLTDRVQLAAMLKGNNGLLLRDSEETYDSKHFSFSGLDAIANLFLQVAAGAADVPMTRLLGQSPGGLNSTGDADLRNYYDRIQSHQELEVSPSMSIFDECLLRSALGTRPPEIFYVWNSLWQTTDKERADIGKTIADTIKTLADSQLFNADVIGKAAENLLIERAVLPGLDSAVEELGEANDDPNAV